MSARRPNPNQISHQLWQEMEHIRTVPCPDPPDGCGQPAGQDCVRPLGFTDEPDAPRQPRRGPGCWRRVQAADKANPAGAHPALPPEAEQAAPGRHLVAASAVRRDLASYREPCRWCHRAVVWAVTPSGDRLPVDAEPSADGVLVLSVDDRGVRTSVPLTKQQLPAAREHGQRLHIQHRETCPKGDRWSRHHPTRR